MSEQLVVDASALVDFLLGNDLGAAVAARLGGHDLHAPAHLDTEVLSALGRLHRSGRLTTQQTRVRLNALAEAPIERHELPPLLLGAWAHRRNLRLVDALYVELADQLDVPLVTTDMRLASVVASAALVSSDDPP